MWVEVLGCVGSGLPVSIKYTGPSVLWRFIGWRSTERIWSTVGVGLSCSEARVIVGLPTGWLSSEEADPKSPGFPLMRMLLYHHGEYQCFSFRAFTCFWRVSVCSCHD